MADPSILAPALSQVGTNTPTAKTLRLLNDEATEAALVADFHLAGSVIFRPGGVAAGNVVTTSAAVTAALAQANGALQVFCDNTIDPCVISTPWNLQGRGVLLPADQAANGVTVTVADGATITDPASIENNLILVLEARTVSPLVFTPAPNPPFPLKNRTFLLFNGATLSMATGALVPGCVLSGMQLVLEMLLFGILDNSNAPTVPVFSMVTGGSVDVTAVDQALLTGTEFGGAAGTTLIYSPDASCPAPSSLTLTNFTGSFVPEPLDQANVVEYNDTAPLLGSTNVQGAIDALKARSVAAGSTPSFVFRPGGAASGNVYVTESALAAATQAQNGAAYEILMDFSLTTPIAGIYAPTTVGLWNLAPNGTWNDAGFDYVIDFANGTTLPTPPAAVVGGLTWQSTQAADVCALAAGTHRQTEFRDAAQAIVNAAGALVTTQGAYALFFTDAANAEKTGGTATAAFVATGAGILNAQLNDFAFFGAGAVGATAGGTLDVVASGPGTDVDGSLYPVLRFTGLYVDFVGTGPSAIPAGGDSASSLLLSGDVLFQSNGTIWTQVTSAYVAATPGNWAASPPTTEAAAIDRLAAAVEALRGSPIP
jgi:hypothetical protein